MEPTIQPNQNPESSQLKRKAPKKLLVAIVSIAIVIIAAVGIVVGLKLYSKVPGSTPSNESAKITSNFPDLSKNYGACSLLTKKQITSTLGKIASTVQDPVNNGIVGVVLIGAKLSNFSADAQSCLYHFAPVSKAAMYTNDNGLTVQVTKFGNSESTTAYQTELTTNPSTIVVSGVGDAAFYTQSATGSTQTYYTLQTFRGNTLYEYTLHLPANTSMDGTTAQKALTVLAED